MSFLKSGLDALLGQTLRRLGLEDPSQLTLDMISRLDRQDQLDLGHQIGLEQEASASAEETAERIWTALQAAMSSHAPPAHPEPTRNETADIPWSYGHDRVTGIAVDPNRLYIYWEVTDDAISEARRRLNAGGDQAWLSLRVYDTSGRIFDGTNAHGYTDERVGRGDRQWFVELGRPGSEAIVELGLKSLEGYFVKIARSGRVEFPRWGTPSSGAPDWMTVRVKPDGIDLLPGDHGAPASSRDEGVRGAGGEAPVPPANLGSFDGGAAGGNDAPAGGDSPADDNPSTDDDFSASAPGQEALPTQTFTTHTRESVERSDRTHTTRTHEWERKTDSWSWETGPLRSAISVPGAVTEHFVGGRHARRIGDRTHVVFGPWEVVIRGIDAHMERTVLGRWETYRSWVTEEGTEVESVVEGEPGASWGSSERLPAGASERRWSLGSEARLGGSSEAWRLGASERRLGGSSEYSFLAASERLLRGASERLLRGASERALKGASEQRFGGASEKRFLGGASEKLTTGGSERRFPRLPPKPEEKA